MGRLLPMLFNTDMVQAILDGRKTATRRAVKYKYSNTEMKMRTDKYGTRLIEIQKDVEGETHGKNPDGGTWHKLLPYIDKNPPCRKGDILYVRETWFKYAGEYIYKASAGQPGLWSGMWRPSIHMPKEAARIWLRVTDVRVEKIQSITNEQILKEGISQKSVDHYVAQFPEVTEEWVHAAHWIPFSDLWNSTIKKADFDLYSWDTNPWVWVIEFERCEKPESI